MRLVALCVALTGCDGFFQRWDESQCVDSIVWRVPLTASPERVTVSANGTVAAVANGRLVRISSDGTVEEFPLDGDPQTLGNVTVDDSGRFAVSRVLEGNVFETTHYTESFQRDWSIAGGPKLSMAGDGRLALAAYRAVSRPDGGFDAFYDLKVVDAAGNEKWSRSLPVGHDYNTPLLLPDDRVALDFLDPRFEIASPAGLEPGGSLPGTPTRRVVSQDQIVYASFDVDTSLGVFVTAFSLSGSQRWQVELDDPRLVTSARGLAVALDNTVVVGGLTATPPSGRVHSITSVTLMSSTGDVIDANHYCTSLAPLWTDGESTIDMETDPSGYTTTSISRHVIR